MYETNRRRFLWPLIVTLVAVPAIWWAVQRDDSGGSGAETAAADASTEGSTGAASVSPLTPEPVGDYEPVYLDGPEGEPSPAIADIAVPAQGKLALYQNATYASSLPAGYCYSKGTKVGERVTVVNLENNHSIICLVQLAPPEQEEDLVLSRVAFLKLADLTDAPIPVEMRQ